MVSPERAVAGSVRPLPDGGVTMHTAGGLRVFSQSADMRAGPFGVVRAVVVDAGSPSALSAGALALDGIASFVWTAGEVAPECTLSNGVEVTVDVDANVPIVDEHAPSLRSGLAGLATLFKTVLSSLQVALPGVVLGGDSADGEPAPTRTVDVPLEAAPPRRIKLMAARLASRGPNQRLRNPLSQLSGIMS